MAPNLDGFKRGLDKWMEEERTIEGHKGVDALPPQLKAAMFLTAGCWGPQGGKGLFCL